MLPPSLDLASIRDAYRRGLKPLDLVRGVLARCGAHDDPAVWIHRVDEAALETRARELEQEGPEGKAALRRAVRDQGQHRRRGAADDRGLSGLRVQASATRRRSSACSTRARS